MQRNLKRELKSTCNCWKGSKGNHCQSLFILLLLLMVRVLWICMGQHRLYAWDISLVDCGLAPSLGPDRKNLSEPYHLEEGEVITRFPQVNLRKDHYHAIHTLGPRDSIADQSCRYTGFRDPAVTTNINKIRTLRFWAMPRSMLI